MDDEELARYSRHILLPQIDLEGQRRLSEAAVLVVGAGGLGSPASMYLASSGIGNITVCDNDQVDLSNLQRQILHGTSDVGKNKAVSARAALESLNPRIVVSSLQTRLIGPEIRHLIRDFDLVVDASDNFPTRFSLNSACAWESKPLVSGSAIGCRGQATVFRHDQSDSPCLQCLYPEFSLDSDTGACSEIGVFAPLTGMIGSILAAEAIKILAGFGECLAGRLLLVDAESMTCRYPRILKDPACPVCSHSALVANDP